MAPNLRITIYSHNNVLFRSSSTAMVWRVYYLEKSPALNLILWPNIRLVALFHLGDLKKFGFNPVLKPLAADIEVLEAEGSTSWSTGSPNQCFSSNLCFSAWSRSPYPWFHWESRALIMAAHRTRTRPSGLKVHYWSLGHWFSWISGWDVCSGG